MTMLVAPVKGAPEDQATDHAMCGQDNANAVIQIARPVASVQVADNATAGLIVAAINSVLPGSAQTAGGNAADLVAQYVPQGYYVIALVWCTPGAIPVPQSQATARHWITCYGDGPSVPYYQCWDATYQTITNLSQCSYVGSNVHVLVKLPPPPAPHEDDEDMALLIHDDQPGSPTKGSISLSIGGVIVAVPTPNDAQNLLNAGVRQAELSDGTYANIMAEYKRVTTDAT